MTAGQPKGLGPNARFIGVPGARTRLSTPNLLLDLDALEYNIAAMSAHIRVAGINLQPHAKGGKSIEIARRQVAAGASGICCCTLGEGGGDRRRWDRGRAHHLTGRDANDDRAANGAECSRERAEGGGRQSGQRR